MLIACIKMIHQSSCSSPVRRMIFTTNVFEAGLYVGVLSLLAVWCWYQYTNRRTLKFARQLETLEPALPILGHILYCLPDLDGVISKFALSLSVKSAAKNVSAFCLWAGPKPFIVIQNPDDIQILLNSTKSLEKGDDYRLVKFALGDGLFTAPVRLWKVIRRQVQPMFLPRNLELMVPRFNQQGVLIVGDLEDHVGRGTVDLLQIIPRHIMTSTGHFLFGETSLIDLGPKSETVAQVLTSITRSLKLFSTRVVKVWLQWDLLFNCFYSKDLQQLKSSQDFALPIVKDFRDRFGETDIENEKKNLGPSFQYLLTDAYSSLIRSHPELVTEQHLCDSINNIFGAADTSTYTLASCLLAISRHTEIQEKLVEEIDLTIGRGKSHVSCQDLNSLTYMDQVLKETLRRFTPAPYMSRKIVEDIAISSGVIPAGTSVYLDIYGNHMNPHFFANPEWFDPDRFLPENVQNRNKLAFMPFSAGPRNCIGKEFAMIELKIALVHILRRFRLSTQENIINFQFQYHATLSRVRGYPVSVEERR